MTKIESIIYEIILKFLENHLEEILSFFKEKIKSFKRFWSIVTK